MKIKFKQSNIKLQTVLPQILIPCLLLTLLPLASGGCKNEAIHQASLDPTDVYTLVSVDGKNVPCDVNHEGALLTVKSGTFTITADNHCISQSTFCVPPHNDINRVVKATYTCQGAELTMRWEGAGVTTGNVNGNTFTMNNEGMIFAYRK